MNDEYQERGIFKQLVLIFFLAWAWAGEKVGHLWRSETFLWWVAGVLFAVAVYLTMTIIVR